MSVIHRSVIKRIAFLFGIVCFSFEIGVVQADEPDWRIYNALLMDTVSKGIKNGVALNRVDYHRLRVDKRFVQVYQTLSSFPLSRLKTQEERLAFYINAYNILALKVVVDHWPVQGIRDVGNWISPVWKRDAGTLGGKTVSLHQVEHEILRLMGEPRIHMAIVCASVSCPDLRAEAYTASKLEQQLEDQTQAFLDNEKKGLSISGETIMVSKIFDWFEDDFKQVGGLSLFLRKYRPDIPVGANIEAELNYDWELNSQ